MKYYKMKIPISGYAFVTVEAEDEMEDLKERALEEYFAGRTDNIEYEYCGDAELERVEED